MSSPRPSLPAGWWWALVPVLVLTAWFVVARQRAADAGTDDLIVDNPSVVLEPAPAMLDAEPVTASSPAEPDDARMPAPPAATAAGADSAAPMASAPVVERAPVPPAEAPPLDGALYSEWTTFDDAVRQSLASGKPVMVAFHAGWNEGSEALRREVFDDVAAGLTVRATVIPVLLVDRTQEDGENGPEWRRLQKRFGVTRLPALVVYSPGSQRVQRQQGWHGSAAVLQWIGDAAAAVK